MTLTPGAITVNEPSGPCWRDGCPAKPALVEGDGFAPDHLTCDQHSLFRNPAFPLPMGYHARTLGFPAIVPYTTTPVVYAFRAHAAGCAPQPLPPIQQVIYPGTAG